MVNGTPDFFINLKSNGIDRMTFNAVIASSSSPSRRARLANLLNHSLKVANPLCFPYAHFSFSALVSDNTACINARFPAPVFNA